MKIPKVIFIIPYRDREHQKHFFLKYYSYIMEDVTYNYEIMFIEQNHDHEFNRGAMKNIGFLSVKDIYPNDYQNISLVFHDIDVSPYKKNLLNYETKRGMVKHFYGFNFTLGGIVSITGHDFENMNGFPNYWGWGYEDNVLHNRALNKGLYISRNNFFKIGDSNILHLIDDFKKILDKTNHDNCKTDNFDNGINYIENLKYDIINNDDHNIIKVNHFTTKNGYNKNSLIYEDTEKLGIKTSNNTNTNSNTNNNNSKKPIVCRRRNNLIFR